jgi:tetratricopeptide (TPR) repeat protein
MSRSAAERGWLRRRRVSARHGAAAAALLAAAFYLAPSELLGAPAALPGASSAGPSGPAEAGAAPAAPSVRRSGTGAEGASAAHDGGFEITPAVRQQLQRLQAEWLHWVSATDRERSEAAVTEMLATADQLGMKRLPDPSLGALAWSLEAAKRLDFSRAAWCLAAAERLDPQRPETAFAAAAVARAQGAWPRVVAALGSAYPRLLWLPLERQLWLQDLLIWSLYLLLLTGALFIGALMATRGGGLFQDLMALASRRLPHALALFFAAAFLLWPLALPAGLAWALLLWSLLLWGYGSPSERAVLVALWLLLGLAPLVVATQRRAVAVRLSPAVKAIESIRERRLYGSLFGDLGILRSSLPDSPAVKHLLADVHRMLGQGDQARAFYREVLDAEPQNAAALLNLGVYAFNHGDTTGAIQYFQQASAADPRNAAAAQYDLSQAYNEAYLFDEAHRALAQAKAIDAERVDRWLAVADQEKVVTAAGGLALIPEIERSLTGPAPALDLVQHGASLVVALGALLLAVALHLARRPYGYAETQMQWRLGHRALDRVRRALTPGLSAAEAGEGARAFLALLLPAALLLMPLFERLGYRIPWGYDGGGFAAWALSLAGLAIYLGLRLGWEWRNAV